MVSTGSTASGTMDGIDQQSAIAAYVDQSAVLLGVALNSERRAGVIAAFTAFNQAATLLMEFPLPPETEQASVFTLP